MPKSLNDMDEEFLGWVQQRLSALEKMEEKLIIMRQLACYAASENHSTEISLKLQQWMDLLQEQVVSIDWKSQWGDE